MPISYDRLSHTSNDRTRGPPMSPAKIRRRRRQTFTLEIVCDASAMIWAADRMLTWDGRAVDVTANYGVYNIVYAYWTLQGGCTTHCVGS